MMVGIIFVIAVLVAGGAYAFFGQNSAAKVVKKMTQKMVMAETFDFTGQIMAEVESGDVDVSFFAGGETEGEYKLDFNGVADLTSVDTPKIKFITQVVSPLMSETIGIELRLIEQVFYAKLSRLGQVSGMDLSFVNDKWIRIDQAELQEQLGTDDQELEDELTAKQKEKIREALAKAEMFKITKQLDDEKINGVNTNHYAYEISQTGLIKLYAEIAHIMGEEKISKEDLGQVEASFNSVKDLSSELWIGKSDPLLYKILFNSVITDTEDESIENEISVWIEFDNINEDVDITVPESSLTVQKMIGQFYGGMMGSMFNGFLEGLEEMEQPGMDTSFEDMFDQEYLMNNLEGLQNIEGVENIDLSQLGL